LVKTGIGRGSVIDRDRDVLGFRDAEFVGGGEREYQHGALLDRGCHKARLGGIGARQRHRRPFDLRPAEGLAFRRFDQHRGVQHDPRLLIFDAIVGVDVDPLRTA
jgi:hypothetical protein